MTDLGKKIKSVREYNSLSQEELGIIVQKTKSTIGRYEKGLMEIPAKVIIDACNYYQLSIDAFVESTFFIAHQENAEKAVSHKRNALLNCDTQQLVNYFNMLSDSAKSTIFSYMEIEVATRSSQDMMLPSSKFYTKPPMFGYIAVYYYYFLTDHSKRKVLAFMEIEILAANSPEDI